MPGSVGSRYWLFFCAVVLPCSLAVWQSWRFPNVLVGQYANFDGQWAAWSLASLLEWGVPFDLSPFNPLSGLGSQFQPGLPWLNPGALMFALPIAYDLQYFLSYAIYLVELAVSLLILFRVLGAGLLTSVLAVQLYALVLFPPWSHYFSSLSWFSLTPANAHLIALYNFGLVILLRLGTRGMCDSLICAAAIAV